MVITSVFDLFGFTSCHVSTLKERLPEYSAESTDADLLLYRKSPSRVNVYLNLVP